MAVSPTVRINVTGARGDSFADVARRVGNIGGVFVPSGSTDADVMALLNSAFGEIVAAAGYNVIASVRAATTVNITLSGAQVIDGVDLIAGDRVLVKDQTSGEQNGIYVVASGAWTRATDFDEPSEVVSGSYVWAQEGSNASGAWVLVTPDPITVGATAQAWNHFSDDALAQLASTSPGKGGDLVVYKAPYTDSIARTIGGKFPDVVGVTDFGNTTTDAATAFQRAMAAADEYGRDLYIPKLDAGARYQISGSLVVPNGMRISGGGSGSGSDREVPGSVLEFEDGSLDCRDTGGVNLHNFRVKRVGSTPGIALDMRASSTGLARTFLQDVSVIGSTGHGVVMSGGWLLTWVNPYIRSCAGIGLLIEQGAFVTGMNSVTLVGGEIQANTVAGIVLNDVKQLNLLGTAIEGNYGPGIGLGTRNRAVNIQAYFEANLGGHIAPYSHEGGYAGSATCLTVHGGSLLQRGASGSPTTPGPTVAAIDIPLCRSSYIEDGVSFSGYATNTSPIIRVADVGDSNRAVGYVGEIYTDSPQGQTLFNDALFFGKAREQTYSFNTVWTDGVNSDPVVVPLPESSSVVRNPSKNATLYLTVEVGTGGNIVLTRRVYDKTGTIIGTAANSTVAVSAGINFIAQSIGDSDNVGYSTVIRAGTSGVDTAVGVTLHSIRVVTHENRVKNVA